MIVEPRLLKLNFGIMCLHILLMSTFVALPGQLAAAGFPAAEHWKIYLVTMLISFVSVVPFIIYAEVKRKMKRVFVGCVAVLLIAEIVLWGAGPHFWELIAGVQLFFLAFNLMEALLPSLISKESPPVTKAPRWASTPPASFSAWRSAARSAAGWTACLIHKPCFSPVRYWRQSGCWSPAP